MEKSWLYIFLVISLTNCNCLFMIWELFCDKETRWMMKNISNELYLWSVDCQLQSVHWDEFVNAAEMKEIKMKKKKEKRK